MSKINCPFNDANIEKFIKQYDSYDDKRIINLLLSKIRLQSKLSAKNRNGRYVRLYSSRDHDKLIRCGENKCTCIKVPEDVLSYFPYFYGINEPEVETKFSSVVLLLFSEWLNIGFNTEIQNKGILKDNSYDPVEMLYFLDYIEAPDIFHSVYLAAITDKILKEEKQNFFRFLHQYQQYINDIYINPDNGNNDSEDDNEHEDN